MDEQSVFRLIIFVIMIVSLLAGIAFGLFFLGEDINLVPVILQEYLEGDAHV